MKLVVCQGWQPVFSSYGAICYLEEYSNCHQKTTRTYNIDAVHPTASIFLISSRDLLRDTYQIRSFTISGAIRMYFYNLRYQTKIRLKYIYFKYIVRTYEQGQLL